MKNKKEFAINSARWTHVITVIIFLIWNGINVFKYGFEQAISMPSFIIMNIITATYFIIYIFLLNRMKGK